MNRDAEGKEGGRLFPLAAAYITDKLISAVFFQDVSCTATMEPGTSRRGSYATRSGNG